jgi:tetratricopeptide (TPR) repeat protein
MKPVAWLLVWAAAWMCAPSQSSAQSSTPRVGYGWCYACNAYMPASHDCVGLRTAPPRWQDDPTPVAPQKSQAEIDAENAGAWSRQAVADIRQFERTGDVQWLNSALKKLFNAEALLRRPSYYRASILSSVNKNIAWCYNEYARLYHKAGQWDKAEKYFRLAWNYHPDSDVYRGNIRKAQESREAEATAARQAAERQQAAEAFERGKQHAGRGEWEAAMKAFEQAVRLVPDWPDYRTVLNVARENWERQIAADAALRAAEEKRRQEVAALVEQSRDYTRRQTDLRDAVVNERKQEATALLKDAKSPFGIDTETGIQGQTPQGAASRAQTAFKQAQTLLSQLKDSLGKMEPFGENVPVEVLAQASYVAQQGQESMNGSWFRGGVSGEDLKKIHPGMPKLRAQMEKVMPVAAQQIQELAVAVKTRQAAKNKVAEVTKEKETALQEVEQAKAKVEEIKAMPEDTEEAKKKKASHRAEAEALLAATTKKEAEVTEMLKKADEEAGKAEVDLVNKRDALQVTKSKLDTLIAGGELPDEKKKGGNSEPPPPVIPPKP